MEDDTLNEHIDPHWDAMRKREDAIHDARIAVTAWFTALADLSKIAGNLDEAGLPGQTDLVVQCLIDLETRGPVDALQLLADSAKEMNGWRHFRSVKKQSDATDVDIKTGLIEPE